MEEWKPSSPNVCFGGSGLPVVPNAKHPRKESDQCRKADLYEVAVEDKHRTSGYDDVGAKKESEPREE